MRALSASLLVLALSGCATGGASATRPRRTVSYRFECNPRDATLVIDEVNLGQCVLWEQRPVGLGPGVHRVRVEREGFLPHESELAGEGPRGTVRVQLRERPE